MSDLKIRICTPFYSEFEAVKSGVRECLAYEKVKFEFEPRQSGPLMFQNRNSLLNDLRSQKKKQKPLEDYDYFLFVDSDITFTVQNVLKLVNSGHEIVASPYLRHSQKFQYNTGYFVTNFPGIVNYFCSNYEKGCKEVDFSGTGFFLIKRNVLEDMEYPWFEPYKIDLGDSAEVIGEDLCFCMKAKKIGYKIFCDFDNPVSHRIRSVNNFEWDIYKSEHIHV